MQVATVITRREATAGGRSRSESLLSGVHRNTLLLLTTSYSGVHVIALLTCDLLPAHLSAVSTHVQ
jgi:hypothetical protein